MTGRIQKIAALSCAVVLLSACGGGGSASNTNGSENTSDNDSTPALPGWTLIWQDEFEQDGLPNSAKWDYDTHRNRDGWYNNELQYYSRERQENARVVGGKLIITARRERLSTASDFGGQNYTSARLMTQGKANWTYGRFEIRAKLPCTLGTWPAIWMLGTGGVWPDDGEIDIMEQKGFSAADKREVLGHIHTKANHAGNGLGAYRALPTACTDFNIYQMTWDKDKVVIGVNGVDYFTYNNPGNGNPNQWPYDKPQYMLLNVAVGGVLGGAVDNANLPATMEVDYVRVYRKN